MKVHLYSEQGKRLANEDCLDVKYNNETLWAGVYDGHGGGYVSNYLQQNLLNELSQGKESYKRPKRVIERQQKILEENHYSDSKECGSTVLVASFKKNDNKVFIHNLGDGRAIIGGMDNTVTSITVDHKPEHDAIRLRENDNEISWDSDDNLYRIDGFSLSRALGDLNTKSLIRDVETFQAPFTKNQFLVLGCDGLWDSMSNNDVVSFINKQMNKQQQLTSAKDKSNNNIAYLLAKTAVRRGSHDNVSVIIVYNN